MAPFGAPPAPANPGESPFPDLAATSTWTAAPPEPGVPAASFGQRLGAHLIDQMAILLVAWFVGRPLGSMLGVFASSPNLPPEWNVTSYIGALLMAAFAGLVFEVFLTGSHLQATPGKLALRLKVTDLRGRPIGYSHAFGRYLMKGLSGSVFCIGFLMQPFTARKQAMHDLLSGTLVLRK